MVFSTALVGCDRVVDPERSLQGVRVARVELLSHYPISNQAEGVKVTKEHAKSPKQDQIHKSSNRFLRFV